MLSQCQGSALSNARRASQQQVIDDRNVTWLLQHTHLIDNNMPSAVFSIDRNNVASCRTPRRNAEIAQMEQAMSELLSAVSLPSGVLPTLLQQELLQLQSSYLSRRANASETNNNASNSSNEGISRARDLLFVPVPIYYNSRGMIMEMKLRLRLRLRPGKIIMVMLLK
jgi:hypothetical protein